MSQVSMERHDSVAIISIDNPPVNALSHAVREGLKSSIEEAAVDDAIEAIVIICAGRTFIAGADIREFGRPPKPPHLPNLVALIEDTNLAPNKEPAAMVSAAELILEGLVAMRRITSTEEMHRVLTTFG